MDLSLRAVAVFFVFPGLVSQLLDHVAERGERLVDGAAWEGRGRKIYS